MSGALRLLDNSWKNEIVAVRRLGYADDNRASVDLDRLSWNDVDEVSAHFGAFEQDRLVSVLRATAIDDAHLFQRVLLFDCSLAEREHGLCLPVGVLARAATAPETKRSGYHMRLRVEALRWLRRNGLHQVWGTMPANSSRRASLERLGYEIFQNHAGWPWLSPTEPKPLLLRFDLAQKYDAVEALASSLDSTPTGFYTRQDRL